MDQAWYSPAHITRAIIATPIALFALTKPTEGRLHVCMAPEMRLLIFIPSIPLFLLPMEYNLIGIGIFTVLVVYLRKRRTLPHKEIVQ